MYIMRMIIVLFHLVLATVFDVRYASVNKTHIVSAFGELLNLDRDRYQMQKNSYLLQIVICEYVFCKVTAFST